MSTEHYRITLTVEGPVFIGNGNEIKKFEYVYDYKSDTVYVIDTLKLFRLMQQRNGMLEKFESHIGQNGNLSLFFANNAISPQQYGSIAKYSYKAGGDPRNNNIREFVKNAYGQPYIPGSSLKGALRTAIMYGIIQDYYNRQKYPIERDKIFNLVQSYETERDFKVKKRYINDIGRISGEFEDKWLHTLGLQENRKNAVNSVMRGLRISDSEPLSVNDLCLCKKCDILPRGDVKSPNLLRECIRPGTKVAFNMDIDDMYFTFGSDFLDKSLEIYFNKQRAQMSKFSAIAACPKPAGDERYIVLGGGSGFVSKTFTHIIMGKRVDDEKPLRTVSAILDKQFGKHGHSKDNEKGVSPHTRKMTLYKREYVDFGICRIDIDKI